jgi:hypothetical protein
MVSRVAAAVLLAASLFWLNGCALLHREPEPEPPPASEQLLARANQAWLARDFEESRNLCRQIVQRYPDDPAREEALLRLAVMEVILPGDGPNAGRALELLAEMDPQAMTAGQTASRDAIAELLDLYGKDREAIRMLVEQNRRLEAQLAGREREAIRQKASLYQWRLDVNQANQRVEQLEVELEKIRQEIKQLKDIDMMLQAETGEEAPAPPDEQ